MTATDRAKTVAQLDQAKQRAERAEHYGDHAGHLIALGDARRLFRKLVTASAER